MDDATTSGAGAPSDPGAAGGPLVWLVIAVLVAVGVSLTVREQRGPATVVTIVFVVAARTGRWLIRRRRNGREHRTR